MVDLGCPHQTVREFIRVGMKIAGSGIPTNAVIHLVDTLRSQIRISAAVASTSNGVILRRYKSIFQLDSEHQQYV